MSSYIFRSSKEQVIQEKHFVLINLQPDDIKERHQELYSVQQAELCHGAQRFLQSHQLLDEVLGVGVLMAVGVPQVPPLHGHQHDGDLTVYDVDSLR